MCDHTTDIPRKQCSKCKQWLPATLDYFHRDTTKKSGLRSACRICLSPKGTKGYAPRPEPAKEGYKRCNRCGKEKPATMDYFTYWAESKDKLRGGCKECFGRQPARFLSSEMKASEGNKICRHCRKEFPATLEHFYPNKTGTDGLRYICKECDLQKIKAYQARNHDKIIQKRKEYNAKNAPRLRKISLEYSRKHQEELRVYRKSTRERQRITLAKYQARKINLPDTFTADQWQRSLSYWKGCCAYCGNQQGLFHNTILCMEHFIPLSSPLCTGTIQENIIPGCLACNSSKSDKNPEEWVIDKFGKHKGKQVLKRIKEYFSWVREQDAH